MPQSAISREVTQGCTYALPLCHAGHVNKSLIMVYIVKIRRVWMSERVIKVVGKTIIGGVGKGGVSGTIPLNI